MQALKGNKILRLEKPIYVKTWQDSEMRPEVKIINCANVKSDSEF